LYLFETQRLNIRKLNEEDYKILYPLHSDPNVMKFIREPDKNIEQTQKRMLDMISYSKLNKEFGLFLAFTKDTDECIGWAIFLHAELNISNPIEIGYRLFPKFWGAGLATELSSRLLKHATEDLKLKKICAVTDPRHEKSMSVLKKCGFSYIEEREFYGHTCAYFEVNND